MDLAIVGGGIGGLAAAVALQHIGIQTTVYESASSFQPLGAGIGIGSNAMLALQQINVGQDILANGMPLYEQRFLNDKGKVMNTIDFSLLKERFGEETIAIQRADLHEALFNKIDSSTFHFKKSVRTFTENDTGVTLYFTDKTKATHDFIIAADGIHSLFRQTFYSHATPRYAGYTCWRGISPNENNVPLHLSNEAWSKKGRFGWAPLHNGDVYWFACINSNPDHPLYTNWTKRELAHYFSFYSPTVKRLISETYDDYFLHHDIYDIAPLKKFNYGKVLLLGDAAHATTPNMGQGAGQAIEDAYELMRAYQLYHTWQEIVQHYNEKRVEKTKKVIQLSRQIGWAAQWDSSLLTTFRNTVFPFVPKSLLFWRLTFLFK